MAQQFIDYTEPDADNLPEGANKINANFSELYGSKAEASDLAAHTGDTTDAHDASAISFTPTGTVAATDVQAAIAEVVSEGGGGGVTDHGALTGLADDDHTQYHTDARGDARYPPLARTISTTAPLTGGGDLSANRTLAVSAASATAQGVVELATDAEAQTGTDTARAITPANLTARTATETRTGVAEIATQAETDTGTDDARFVTPLKLATHPPKNVVFETFIEGLTLEWVSTTSIKIKAGAAWVAGASKIVNLAADVTLVNTTDYTLAASRWYYVYLTDTGTITVVRDDGTNPLPVAYKDTAKQQTSNSNRRYLGAFKSSATSTILKFRDVGNERQYLENISAAPLPVLSAGTATTSTSVSCSGVVPVSSRTLVCQLFSGLATSQFCFIGFGDATGTLSTTNYSYILYPQNSNYLKIELNSSQAFNYMQSVASAGLYVYSMGYIEER